MLLEEFDPNKSALFNPADFRKPMTEMPKTCVSFFSKSLMKFVKENFELSQIATIKNSTMEFPIYKTKVNEVELAILQSPVGAPACVSNYEEIIAMGIKNFLLVGCCGCLDEKIEEYSIILPTSALRDEGTSYHYAPACDETEIDKDVVEELEKVLKKLKLNYTKGKTWTTDAIFRETKEKINRRKEQGAIAVEMECSAMNVVSKFRGIKFGQLFYGADNLGGEEYDPRNFVVSTISVDNKTKIVPVAFECALALNEKF